MTTRTRTRKGDNNNNNNNNNNTRRRKSLALYHTILASARKDPPASGGIICIGSSHLQYWQSIKKDLAPLAVYIGNEYFEGEYKSMIELIYLTIEDEINIHEESIVFRRTK